MLRDDSQDDEDDIYERPIEWSLLESNEDYMVLKIKFDDPDSLANLQDDISLRIAFWGVDLFKSSDGNEVRFGTQLHWKVFRQISDKE